MSASLHMSGEALREVAETNGVCVRPILHEVRDTETDRIHLVPTPCGARRESKCKPCADKARRLRMQQCREGWHLEIEPDRPEQQSKTQGSDRPESDRRTRSTRRRQDAPDLPRVPIEDRTIGRSFTGRSGKVYRPSMFLTFTLPSYGPVRADGTPVDPAEYDYRRAALDALHFSKLVDRVWQNVRRAVGFKVQYFAAVEPQRRLAPHLHAAVRGAVPREIIRQVIGATYHQVWWPPCDDPTFTDRLPLWREDVGYVDPDTGARLPTWSEALDRVSVDDHPTHVLRFGRQMDVQGILATDGDADRRVAYLTKYLAKSFGDAYASEETATRRQRAHLHRLHEEVRWLPCSPACWNWLRFGVQPKGARGGMIPGSCPSKAHDSEHLGCGGRRVLVSRMWTGKTLKDHKADRTEVVRQVLLAAGIEKPEVDRLSVLAKRKDGAQRFHWTVHDPMDSTIPLYRQVMTAAIRERIRWQAEYEAARSRAGPVSTLARPPDIQPTSAGVASVRGERSESRTDTKCP